MNEAGLLSIHSLDNRLVVGISAIGQHRIVDNDD